MCLSVSRCLLSSAATCSFASHRWSDRNWGSNNGGTDSHTFRRLSSVQSWLKKFKFPLQLHHPRDCKFHRRIKWLDPFATVVWSQFDSYCLRGTKKLMLSSELLCSYRTHPNWRFDPSKWIQETFGETFLSFWLLSSMKTHWTLSLRTVGL